MTVRLVADDLTGALDSAAQFTALEPLPVLLRPKPPFPPGSFALDLSCRDGSETDAVDKATASLPCLLGGDVAFKKIDSLLRGHWAAEVAALAAAGGFRQIILAPAFPAQGRITSGGVQLLVGADGTRTPVAEPALQLARHGITARYGLVGLPAPGEAATVMLCDAVAREDLDGVAAAGQRLPGPTLWCGSAGLAQALARRSAPVVRMAQRPHLVVVGTNHPVATAQVAALRAAHSAWLAALDGSGDRHIPEICRTLAGQGVCVAYADLGQGLAADVAARTIARSLAALARDLVRPATLTVVGGETFATLCRGLDADELLVDGEHSPGVPASAMTSGAWRGTRCFSKSGAFGAAGWLVDYLES